VLEDLAVMNAGLGAVTPVGRSYFARIVAHSPGRLALALNPTAALAKLPLRWAFSRSRISIVSSGKLSTGHQPAIVGPIDENRWRASRYGIDGKLIDFGRKCEVDERDLLHEMLEFIATEVDELGNPGNIAHIERIMREGTGADRQLMVWERTQDMKAVVDNIVEETYEGLSAGQPADVMPR
jgi:hypothetical protein